MARSVDLCRLRPGDVIFTLYPAASSFGTALLTRSLFSHAMIVLYPDIWFETDGAGSGFKVIEDVRAYTGDDGSCSIIADLPYIKFDVFRLPTAPPPDRILSSVARHIARRYPEPLEFLPLLVGLNRFPRFAERLVQKLGSHRAQETGSYCSQLVFKILDETVGLNTYRYNGHISPGRLRKSLIRRDGVTAIDVPTHASSATGGRDEVLEHKYSRLALVTNKLASFQYPHDRASQQAALKRTLEETGIPLDPSWVFADADALRAIITRPRYFRLHEIFWPSRYR